MGNLYLNEVNEIIQIISQSENLATVVTKDSSKKTYPLSKLKRIELGDDPVEGLCIVKFPVPMAAVVNPRDPVPLRKSNVDNWKEFYNKASIKPANESSKFLCFISPEFRKENQILFLDQLQDYLQNKGLGEIEFS